MAKPTSSTNGGGTNVPAVQPSRMILRSPDGNPIDNVHNGNRHDVNPRKPWIVIHLMTEDLSDILYVVEIPYTREFPDVVMWEGRPYEVSSTRLDIPQYKDCMVAEARKPK